MRELGKMFLNNLWRKFGQKYYYDEKNFISLPVKFFKLKNNYLNNKAKYKSFV